MEYKIDIEYDRRDEDHWQSQQSQMFAMHNIGIEKLRWHSGNSIPKNWVGYSEENPSPGFDIDTHRWIIECDQAHLTMLTLKFKLTIIPMPLSVI